MHSHPWPLVLHPTLNFHLHCKGHYRKSPRFDTFWSVSLWKCHARCTGRDAATGCLFSPSYFFPLLIFFKRPFGCLVPSLKRRINKPKHYSSKFNIAYLPGTGLRESEKHHIKTVPSSDLEGCLGRKGLAQQDVIPSVANEAAPAGPAEHAPRVLGNWYSHQLLWPFQERGGSTECRSYLHTLWWEG